MNERSKSSVLPVELLRSVPRHVVLTAAGKATGVVAVLLILGGIAAGIGANVLAERDRALQETIARERVATEAVVTNVVRRRGDDAKTTVSYVFSANGREYAGQTRLRKRESAGIEPGTRIAVEYMASTPAMNWPAGRPPQGVPVFLLLAPIPLAMTGVVMLIMLKRRRQLLTYGRATEARVIGSKRFSHGSHGGRGYHVDFEFRLLSGARRTGRFHVPKDPPAEGAPVVIVYDTDEPARHARYPMDLFKVSS
jgi:hypothetical protein